MIVKRKMPWLIFLLLLTLVSCAKDDETKGAGKSYVFGFQINQEADPYDDFAIISILKDGGTLEEIYDDIDGNIVSERLADVVNANIDEFVSFSNLQSNILENHTSLIITLLDSRVKGIVELLIDKDPANRSTLYDYGTKSYADIDAFYDPSMESSYLDDFYAFLDELSDNNRAGAKTGMKEMVRMGQKLMQYMLDTKEKDELRDDMQELIDDLTDPDFEEDFVDITEILGKMLVQADYPMWLDSDGNPVEREDIDPDSDTNTGLGNPVDGANILLAWVNKMMADAENRELLNEAIREIANVFNPTEAETNKKVLKQLVYNIEDTLTQGGATYKSDERYHQSDAEIESNSELGGGLKEFFPALMQLNLRSDRDGAMIEDNLWRKKLYPVHQMVQYLKNLQFDPDVDDIEGSIINMVKCDLWGRDRTDPESGAYATPFLEHTLYTIATATNLGFEDGGATGEVDPTSIDGRKNHCHGKNVNGLTLNDSLFSIKTHALLEQGNTSILGLFDLTLRSTDGENIARSYKPFKRTEMGQKRFYYNQNYSALYLASGACALDAGAADGGQISASDTTMNSYKPYNPAALDETDLATWIANGTIRICFNGEGPYYYADPNAKTVTVNGKTYYQYLRPNGKVYALVNKDSSTWEYLYPTDVGDAADPDKNVLTGYLTPTDKLKGVKEPKAERFNRYKAQWNSDYYIIKYPLLLGNTYISPTTSGGNATTKTVSATENAGCLTYKEIISEEEPKRACASPMEAFYRNWEYYWYEKKIVLVIPLYLSVDVAALSSVVGTDLSPLFGNASMALGALYTILEGNGASGLGDARKFRGNHVWAKKGTNGASTLPGDFRLEIVASLVTDSLDLGLVANITEQMVYDTVFDKGHAATGFIAKNAPCIARLAFPKSPQMDRGKGVTDYALGSLEFEVGDAIWEERSAFLPIFISLLAGVFDNTPTYPSYDNPNNATQIKTGTRAFIDGLTPVLTPIMYYQKAQGEPPYNCWKPRTRGDNLSLYGNHKGNAWTQSSAELYTTTNPLVNWNGSSEEEIFFMPPPMKTFLNMLVDSDLSQPATRMDGILPVLLTQTKAVTSIFKMLLSDVNDTDELPQALEQILTAMKSTKGEMVKIQEGEAKYGTGGSRYRYIFPDWMFVEGVESSKDAFGVYQTFTGARDEDIIFDDVLDTVIGQDAILDAEKKVAEEGYGIADYPDDKKTSDGQPNLEDEDWKDFEDGYDDLVNLVYKESKYSLVESIITINESFFGNGHIYSDDQISGLLFTLGKLFTYYDKTKKSWIYQGEEGFDDLYTTLTESLPDLHDQLKDHPTEADGKQTYTTNNYWDFLTIASGVLEKDGLVDYMIDAVTVDAKWNQVFSDLDIFLNQDFISNNDPLWSTTATLLQDMATATEDSKAINEDLEQLYKKYGFQLN